MLIRAAASVAMDRDRGQARRIVGGDGRVLAAGRTTDSVALSGV